MKLVVLITASVFINVACKTRQSDDTSKTAAAPSATDIMFSKQDPHNEYSKDTGAIFVWKLDNPALLEACKSINSLFFDMASESGGHYIHFGISDPGEYGHVSIDLEVKYGEFLYPQGWTCLSSGISKEHRLGYPRASKVSGDSLASAFQSVNLPLSPSNLTQPPGKDAYRIGNGAGGFIEFIPHTNTDRTVYWQVIICGANK